jgi:NADH-quinone oxidoreductase subunit N
VLEAALAAGHLWLVIVAVLMSLIGAFYYLRIVKLMYFDAPTDSSPIIADRSMQITLSVNGIAVVLLGVLPGPLMTACFYAISQSIAH